MEFFQEANYLNVLIMILCTEHLKNKVLISLGVVQSEVPYYLLLKVLFSFLII